MLQVHITFAPKNNHNVCVVLQNVKDIFVDGTFKRCARFFFQMFSIYECKNGNILPMLFSWLPSKTQECYENMLNFVLQLCEQRNITLKPLLVHTDFEQSLHSAIMRVLLDLRLNVVGSVWVKIDGRKYKILDWVLNIK